VKKVLKASVLFGVSMAIFLGFSPQNASAAWSSWQSFDGFKQGCKVRVYTDATTYTRNAKTVDVKAEQNGNCGTIYYNMFLSWKGYPHTGLGENTPTGSFSSVTPLKSITIIRPIGEPSTWGLVYLEMKKSSNGDVIARAQSPQLTFTE